MPLDDLDLEFEDEDELKKKKSEAVHVDVDLEFQAPSGVERVRPSGPPPRPSQPGSAPARVPPSRPAVVQKLDDARAAAAPVKRPAPVAAPRVAGTSALKEDYDVESEQIVAMRAQMEKTQFDAEVKVAVADFKTEILSELNGDMKLMEHQIGQLLVRINAKHPDMKQEVLMIKKILADFTAKKRK